MGIKKSCSIAASGVIEELSQLFFTGKQHSFCVQCRMVSKLVFYKRTGVNYRNVNALDGILLNLHRWQVHSITTVEFGGDGHW